MEPPTKRQRSNKWIELNFYKGGKDNAPLPIPASKVVVRYKITMGGTISVVTQGGEIAHYFPQYISVLNTPKNHEFVAQIQQFASEGRRANAKLYSGGTIVEFGPSPQEDQANVQEERKALMAIRDTLSPGKFDTQAQKLMSKSDREQVKQIRHKAYIDSLNTVCANW